MSLPPFLLGLVSDLHLEHDPGFVVDTTGLDVLVAVGDILSGHVVSATGVDYFASLATDLPVLYVPGNHEFDGTTVAAGLARLRRQAKGTGVRVLYRDAVDLLGVRFLGATLWSGFDLFGPAHRAACQAEALERLPDFRNILGPDGRRLTPAQVREEHLRDVAWLTQQLALDPQVPKVMLTHFAPARGSLMDKFRRDPLAAYWVNPCEGLVKQALLAVHGHTHVSVDYRLTAAGPQRGRVMANAKGFTSTVRLADVEEQMRPLLVAHYPVLASQPEVKVPENPRFRNPLRLAIDPQAWTVDEVG